MRGWHYESQRHSLAARGIQTKGYPVQEPKTRFTNDEIGGLRFIREMLRELDGLSNYTTEPTNVKKIKRIAELSERIYDRIVKFGGDKNITIRAAKIELMMYKRGEDPNSRAHVIRSLEILRFAFHTNEELRNMFLGHERNSKSEAADIAKQAFDIQASQYRIGSADRYLSSKFIEERIE